MSNTTSFGHFSSPVQLPPKMRWQCRCSLIVQKKNISHGQKKEPLNAPSQDLITSRKVLRCYKKKPNQSISPKKANIRTHWNITRSWFGARGHHQLETRLPEKCNSGGFWNQSKTACVGKICQHVCLQAFRGDKMNTRKKESISENVLSSSGWILQLSASDKLKETTRHFVGVPQLQGSYWQMYWTDWFVFVFLCQRHRFVVLNAGIILFPFSNATWHWRPSNGNQWPEPESTEQRNKGLIKGLPKLWEGSEWCVCWSFDFFIFFSYCFIVMVTLTKPVYTSKRLLLTLDFVVVNHVWGKNGYDLPFGATNSKTMLQGCKCPSHTHKSQPENILCVCRLESHCAPSHTQTMFLHVSIPVSFQDELCSFGAAVSFGNWEESYTVVRHWQGQIRRHSHNIVTKTILYHSKEGQILKYHVISCWHVFWPVKLVPQRHSKSWLLLSGGSCCWRSAFAEPSMFLGKC